MASKEFFIMWLLFQCILHTKSDECASDSSYWCRNKRIEKIALCIRSELKTSCDSSLLQQFYENYKNCRPDYCTAQEIDYCKGNACNNNGICSPRLGSHVCVCDDTHHGLDCSISDINSFLLSCFTYHILKKWDISFQEKLITASFLFGIIRLASTGKFAKEIYFIPAPFTEVKPEFKFKSCLVFMKDPGENMTMLFSAENSGDTAIVERRHLMYVQNAQTHCLDYVQKSSRILTELQDLSMFCMKYLPEKQMFFTAIYYTVSYNPSIEVIIEHYPKPADEIKSYDPNLLTLKVYNGDSEEFLTSFRQVIIYRPLVCPTEIKLEMCGKSSSNTLKLTRKTKGIIRSILGKNRYCQYTSANYTWDFYDYGKGIVNNVPDIFISFATTDSTDYEIQPYSLPIGTYKVILSISISGRAYGTNYATTHFDTCYIEVQEMPLYAHIKGGSSRTIAESENLVLDATNSYDPNEPPNNQAHLQWSWKCDDQSERFCRLRTFQNGLYKLNKKLSEGKVYIFTLELSSTDGSRKPVEVSQSVSVTKNPQPLLEISCLKNCGLDNFKTNPKEVVYLEVNVLNQLDIKNIVWRYSVEDGKEKDVDFDMKQIGTDDRILIIKENTLSVNTTYTFIVSAISNDGVTVGSNAKIIVNHPPVIDNCTVLSDTGSPLIPVSAKEFDIVCYDLVNNRVNQLNYEFYQMSSKIPGQGTLLGYSISGRLENVILTEETIRVKVSDKYGMYTDYFTSVKLTKFVPTDRDMDKMVSTLRNLASSGDSSSAVRIAGAIIDVMENSTEKQVLIENMLETLDKGKVLDIFDVKLYSSTLRKIATEGIPQLKNGMGSKAVRSMGSTMFSLTKELLSSIKNMDNNASSFMDEDVNNIAMATIDCSDAIVNSRDESIFNASTGSLAKFSIQKQYKEGTANVVRALGLTGMSIISKLLPQEEETVIGSNDTLMWVKVDCPENLSNLTGIPKNSTTKLKIPDKLSKMLQVKSENVALEVITLKNNPYWWDEGGEDVASEIISVRMWSGASSNMKMITDIGPETLDIYLHVKDFKSETLTGSTTMPDPLDSDDQKDLAVVVHSFEVPPENSNGKLFVEFIDLQDTELKVLMSINLRPDYELVMEHGKSVNSNKSSLSQAYENVTSDSIQFIGILPGPNVRAKESVKYSMNVYSIQCKTRQITTWTSPACIIGEETSNSVVHCKCYHMSFFGSSIFVAPNMLNPIKDAYLFLTLKDNPLVFSIIVTLLILYVILLIWAMREDRRNEMKRKVIVLQDNFPGEEYLYMIAVYTAFNIGSGTDANVGIQLIGSLFTSRTHILRSSERKVLRRNSDDWFLLFTSKHLGTLECLKLWHDNSGLHPDWYCKKIVVFDMVQNVSYTFIVEQWMSVWPGEYIQVVVSPSSVEDVYKWKQVVVHNIICNLREKHLWFSIFLSHPRTVISKSKRLTMAYCIVMITFLTGIMFYGVAKGGALEDQASYSIKLRQIIVAVQSAFIAAITTTLVFTCFKRSQMIKPVQSIDVFTDFNVLPDQGEQQRKETNEPQTNKKGFIALFLSKALLGIAKGRPLIPIIAGKESPESLVRRKRWAKCGWIISQVVIWGSGYLTIMYGLKLGKVISQLWITSASFCFINNIFFSAPMRIIVLSFLLSAFGEMYNVSTFECEVKSTAQKEHYGNVDFLDHLLKLRTLPMYRPIPEERVQALRKSAVYRNNLLQFVEFLATVLFILTVWHITGELWKKKNYYVNSHLNSTLSINTKTSAVALRDVTNPSRVIDYVISTLVPSLYKEKWYNQVTLTSPEETLSEMGWADDAAHRQIGVPQLRQLRVRPGNCSSLIDQLFNITSVACLSAFNDETEDKGNYGEEWGPINKFINKPVLLPWSYTNEMVDEASLYGESGVKYHSGGYIMRLSNTQKKCNTIMSDLIDTGWLDIRMRAFIVELSLYNPNTDTHSLISVLIEHFQSGAFTSRVQVLTIHISFNTVIAAFFGYLLILFNLRILKVMNRNGIISLLSHFWSCFDIILFGLSDAAVIAEFLKFLKASSAVHDFQKVGDSDFFYFSEIVYYQRVSLTLWCFTLCLAPLRITKFKLFLNIFKSAFYTLYKNMKFLSTLSLFVTIIILLQLHIVNFTICPQNQPYNVETKYFNINTEMNHQRSPYGCSLIVSLMLSLTCYMAVVVFQTVIIYWYKTIGGS